MGLKPLTEKGPRRGRPGRCARQSQVEAHLERVVAEHGGIDISFNVISVAYSLGEPLHDIPVEEFVLGIADRMRTNYLTVRERATNGDAPHGVVLD